MFDRIIGVDIDEQPDYPFEFIQQDALTVDISDYEPDFIWASPPCQSYLAMREKPGVKKLPDLIPAVRDMLAVHPWTCIENVSVAPIRPDIVLEGGNVGIAHMKRRRKFEVSWPTGTHPKPFTIEPILFPIYGSSWHTGVPKLIPRLKWRQYIKPGLNQLPQVAEVEELWDVHWLTKGKRHSLTEMIPPAYATYVMRDAVAHGFERDFPSDLRTFAKELFGAR